MREQIKTWKNVNKKSHKPEELKDGIPVSE